METFHFCKICSTKPDQLSHHKAHLTTQKHKNNYENAIIDMKIFSIFGYVKPADWEKSEYKDYIINKYLKETAMNETEMNEKLIKKWILDKKLSNNWWDMDYSKFIKEYSELGNFDFSINCRNWIIDKILKYNEHIKITPDPDYLLLKLRQYTKTNLNTIKNIRDGSFDVAHLIKSKNIDCKVYDDKCLRDACLLFHYINSETDEAIIFIHTNSESSDVPSGFIITEKEKLKKVEYFEDFFEIFSIEDPKKLQNSHIIKEKLINVFYDNKSKLIFEISSIEKKISLIENEQFTYFSTTISFLENPINLPIEQIELFFKKKHENQNLIEKLKEEIINYKLEYEFCSNEISRIENLEKSELKTIIQICKYLFYFDENIFIFKKYSNKC